MLIYLIIRITLVPLNTTDFFTNLLGSHLIKLNRLYLNPFFHMKSIRILFLNISPKFFFLLLSYNFVIFSFGRRDFPNLYEIRWVRVTRQTFYAFVTPWIIHVPSLFVNFSKIIHFFTIPHFIKTLITYIS